MVCSVVYGEADQSALSKNPHQAQWLSLLVACVLTTPRPKKENRPLQNRIKIECCVVAQPVHKMGSLEEEERGQRYILPIKKTLNRGFTGISWNPRNQVARDNFW